MAQLFQLPRGARRVHGIQALAELLGAQAPGRVVLAQRIRSLLALGVGGTHAGSIAHASPNLLPAEKVTSRRGGSVRSDDENLL